MDKSAYCPNLFTWHHCMCLYVVFFFFTLHLCQKVLELSFTYFMSMTTCHTCLPVPSPLFFWAWLSSSLPLSDTSHSLLFHPSPGEPPLFCQHSCPGAASGPSSEGIQTQGFSLGPTHPGERVAGWGSPGDLPPNPSCRNA